MKIVDMDTWTVSIPYVHDEISSRVARSGVTDTIVRLTADNGLIGWGECTSGPDAASIEQAVPLGPAAADRPRSLAERSDCPRFLSDGAVGPPCPERQLRVRRH